MNGHKMNFFLNFFKNLVGIKTAPRIKRYSGRRRIFLISDLHLDHENIIRHCHRPFRNVHEMNSTLINNWNRVVRRNDIVFFLGDLAGNTDYWYRKLNGKIFFIKGNHDHPKKIKFYHRRYLTYRGITFLLIHSPWDVPKDWKGWVIHGHTHNHDTRFPFINRKNKRINVSCEVIGYKPINLDVIRKMIN